MRYLLAAILLCYAASTPPWSRQSSQAAEPEPAGAAPIWGDSPTPFQPAPPRSEREDEKLSASALYAHGRLLFQRHDFAGALRRYQRAWRADPEGTRVLLEIVTLAYNLNRRAEAARYAVIAAERKPEDPLLLTRLAVYLTQQNDYPRAIKLYEKALELRGNEPTDVRSLLVRLELGRLHLLNGEIERSVEAFAAVRDALLNPEQHALDKAAVKQVVGDEPDRTYALIGESFLAADQLDEAQAMFEKSHEAQPNQGLLDWRLARIEEARGNTDAALQKLEAYLHTKLSAAGGQAYRLLAKLLRQVHDDEEKSREELLQRLQDGYRDDPANATLGYYLAGELRRADKLERAEQIYQELLKARPAANAYRGLVDVYRRRREFDPLLDILGQVAIQAASLDHLGDVLQELVSDEDAVSHILEQTRQRREDQSLGKGEELAAALLAVEVKKYDDADEFFSRAAAEAAPSKSQVMIAWGLAMLFGEQFERAAQVFEQAITENVMPKENARLYLQRASALERAGQTDEAARSALRAAALSPQSANIQSGLALLLYRAKRYEDGEKQYLRVIDQFDSNYDSEEVRQNILQARMILSNICVMQGRLAEAEEWLEQVLDEYPEDVGALNDLGYLWADQGKHLHRALDMAKRAVDEEPDNAAYRDSLGWAYYRLERYQEAVRELEEAAQGDQPDGVILDHLGDAYGKLNQKKNALDAWRKALQAMSEDEEPEKRSAIEAKIREYNSQ